MAFKPAEEMNRSLFLLFLSIIYVSARDRIGCRDQNNNPVDWWAGYKLPEIKDSPIQSVSEGYGFFYLDVNTPDQWVLSSVDLSSQGQALSNTLKQLYDYKNQGDVFHLLYNDEFPNGTYSLTSGHTKGSLLFDFTAGFWLIHSIPKFPSPDSYAYAQNARRYGQSMLCISFPYKELQAIGGQLLYNQPFMYSSALPSKMATENPELAQVLAGKTVTKPPWTSQYTMISQGGNKFISFAKQGHWHRELYHDLVAPKLQVSLNTETWQNGGGDIHSWCDGQYSVHNVRDIQLPNSIAFPNHDDHSKWAVASDTTTSPYVCIGDINRQYGQLRRGGGTMCMMNKQLWNVYNSSVASVWPCTSKGKPPSKTNVFEKNLKLENV